MTSLFAAGSHVSQLSLKSLCAVITGSTAHSHSAAEGPGGMLVHYHLSFSPSPTVGKPTKLV